MKSFFATASSALAFLATVLLQFATALPSNAGVSTAQLHHVIGGITWTGHIFAHDEHETTLRGDANQIWEQILAIDPNYEKESGMDIQQPSRKLAASKDAGAGIPFARRPNPFWFKKRFATRTWTPCAGHPVLDES